MINYLFKSSLIALFVLTFFDGNSQTFDYFENDPEWRLSNTNYTGIDPMIQDYGSIKEFIYYIGGDSLVNDTSYLMLYERGATTYFGNSPQEFNALAGLIRQEGKKVYQRVFSQEILLYDFDLEIGDIFPDLFGRYYNNPLFPETVESIDSILINGNYHKILYGISSGPIIEGIGHGQGVFFDEPIGGTVDYTYRFHCYRQLEEVEYVADEWLECNFNVSVAEWQVEPSLSVYPNPTSQDLTIESSGPPILSVLIYDQTGTTVKADLEVNRNQLVVDVSDLTSGLYFITLTYAQGIQTEKLVVE